MVWNKIKQLFVPTIQVENTMSEEKKMRVSSKQRLDLVRKALEEFNRSSRELEDYVRFVDDTEEALTEKLDPRAK